MLGLIHVQPDSVEKQIEEIVNRETHAWDNKDVDLLMTIFHPHMVWPWPKDSQSHDPLDWDCLRWCFNRMINTNLEK